MQVIKLAHRSDQVLFTCLRRKEFEFYDNGMQPELGDKRVDMYLNSLQNVFKNLKNEILEFANESEKSQTDDGTDLIRIEPTVYRDHLFSGLRTDNRLLPPRAPTSDLEVVNPALKSCLKTNRDNQKSFGPVTDTARTFLHAPSERNMPHGAFNSTAVPTTKVETAVLAPTSDGYQPTLMVTTHSTVKSMTDHSLDTETLSWDEDMDHADDPFDVAFNSDCKEHQFPQPTSDMGLSEQPSFIPTIPNVVTSEEQASASVSSENASFKPEIRKPTSDPQMESGSLDMTSCSGRDALFQEAQNKTISTTKASSNSCSVQRIMSTRSNLPPRYTATIETWQEDKDFESCILDECHTPPLLSPTKNCEKKAWRCDEEITTSLDSECETERLLAEVIAAQSRLEDLKMAPLDYRSMLAMARRNQSHIHQRGKVEVNSTEDSNAMSSKPDDGHNGRSVIEVKTRQHVFYTKVNTSHDDKRESIQDEKIRGEKTVEHASKKDNFKEDEPTTAQCATDGTDDSTMMNIFEDVASRRKFHGGVGETPWKHEAGQQGRQKESTDDPGCLHLKNDRPVDSTVVSPFPCTITTPLQPMGSTLPAKSYPEKAKLTKGLHDQQTHTRRVLLQTGEGQGKVSESPRGQLKSSLHSTNGDILHCSRAENMREHGNCSVMSTEKMSKYLNIGCRDLREEARLKYPKQHGLYSSNALLQVENSQPGQSPPKAVKQHVSQNRQGQPCRLHDSLGDKENYSMSSSNDQERSILASLERLDWKLAAISARAMNRTITTPSLISQNQTSIQSAPAATRFKESSTDGTPRKVSMHPLRPSSVKTHKPPTRNFRQRRIVGVTNKFHQDIYN
ncbi:uncharacterized protein [Physcomitrium patens]|uniref:uncharacterized protein isoform X2 n=1 Tax=Physcomitrium patens TaxID=3218 RepID=UPI003CCE022B